MADIEKPLSRQEKYACRHYSSELGCNHPKTTEIKTFLRSIKAIGKTFVDTKKWTPEEWQQYEDSMAKLPDGTDSVNLPTGYVKCDWFTIPGSNQLCNDWDCPGKETFSRLQAENPNGLIIIR